MKKVLSIVLAAMLCLTMACSVAADFVPSISYKNINFMLSFDDGNGKKAYGMVTDADGNVTYLYDCLSFVTIAEALDKKSGVPADIVEKLVEVYDNLSDGDTKLPYKKFDKKIKADEVVIRELVDISFTCEEHKDILDGEGTTIELLFDLGVDEDKEVYVFAYVDGEWENAVEVINNGDGTVTVVLEELCPIAFSVEDEIENIKTKRLIDKVVDWLKKILA